MKNSDSSQEYDELKAITKILKQKLILMMVQKWNGKDFTNIAELSGMADDIIEIISEMGNENG